MLFPIQINKKNLYLFQNGLRNLYVNNFGCHDFDENISHMFICPENEESRGSQEISSCQVKYIKICVKICKKNNNLMYSRVNY